MLRNQREGASNVGPAEINGRSVLQRTAATLAESATGKPENASKNAPPEASKTTGKASKRLRKQFKMGRRGFGTGLQILLPVAWVFAGMQGLILFRSRRMSRYAISSILGESASWGCARIVQHRAGEIAVPVSAADPFPTPLRMPFGPFGGSRSLPQASIRGARTKREEEWMGVGTHCPSAPLCPLTPWAP